MNEKFPIKPMYTLNELKKILGLKSNNGTKSLLERLHIPMHLISRRYIIFLTDIQLNQPDLYNSILEANNIHNLYKKESEPDLDQGTSAIQFFS